MSYFDEEFYYETGEFEEEIDNLKQSLKKSIKEKFIQEMYKLKKENEELQTIKKDWKKLHEDHTSAINELQRAISNASYEARRLRLEELLSDKKIFLYSVDSKYYQGEKCDKCDDHRKLNYRTPRGKNQYEDCECSIKLYKYVPKQIFLYEFSSSTWDNSITLWYKQYQSDYDKNKQYFTFKFAEDSVRSENFYSPDMSFDNIKNKFEIMFKNEEDCQKYCDWLNEKIVQK